MAFASQSDRRSEGGGKSDADHSAVREVHERPVTMRLRWCDGLAGVES
jgi:hypothetical protein